eukprot:4240804-Pyramimonas_sp.AAC.2
MDGIPICTCTGIEGDSFTRRGELLKAAAALSKAIKSRPSDPELYVKRARILLELNKVSKVISDAVFIIKLQPESYLGHFLK